MLAGHLHLKRYVTNQDGGQFEHQDGDRVFQTLWVGPGRTSENLPDQSRYFKRYGISGRMTPAEAQDI
jgi:hypothetical protein